MSNQMSSCQSTHVLRVLPQTLHQIKVQKQKKKKNYW